MEKKNLAPLLVIVAVAAGFLGYSFGRGQTSLPVQSETPELLSSKLMRNISASFSGNVVSVLENVLTIKENDVSLSLEMPENVNVSKQPELSGKLLPLPPEQIKPEDLKAGDLVNVSVLLDNNDKIVALNIMVLPKIVEPSPPAPTE